MKDGGSAFPVLDAYSDGNGGSRLECRYFGMTPRDYFAGQALVGLVTNWADYPDITLEAAAKQAYGLADAMIAQREKEGASDVSNG
jgi:hypothetical protein